MSATIFSAQRSWVRRRKPQYLESVWQKQLPFYISSDKRKHVATIARVTRAVRWPDTVPGTTGDRFERSSLLRRRTVIAYALPALPVAAVNLVRATVPGSARASRTRATRVPAELVGGTGFL